MENLSIQDPGPPGQQPAQQMGRGIPPEGPITPQPPPQLPPQMFTTAAQLLDLTDKKLMVSLRDGRKLIGVLRSWDQFANIVLQSTIERIFVPPTEEDENARGLYADIPLGIFLVRGENVLLLGELDLDKDDEPPAGYDQADLDLVKRLAKERKNEAKTKHKSRVSRLGKIGFEGENMGEILF